MKTAIIGLGKMGSRMATRLCLDGFEVNAYDLNKGVMDGSAFCGINTFETPYKAVNEIPKPRIVLLMVPAGKPVDNAIERVRIALENNDILIDCGNSHYKDSIRRSNYLRMSRIGYLDAGVSGGLEGALNGASITVGGNESDFETAEAILEALACKDGLKYLGKSGNGHYAKMVHNAIEYSLMQAYAEGIELLAANGINEKDAVDAWTHGSVIRSWLLDLVSNVVSDKVALNELESYAGGGETGRWAVEEALKRGVTFGMTMEALKSRGVSRKENLAIKIIAALRNQFGGHEVKKK